MEPSKTIVADNWRVLPLPVAVSDAALALGGQQADHFAVEGLDADAVAERVLVAEQLALAVAREVGEAAEEAAGVEHVRLAVQRGAAHAEQQCVARRVVARQHAQAHAACRCSSA